MLTGEEIAILSIYAQAKVGSINPEQDSELREGLSERALEVADAIIRKGEGKSSADKIAQGLIKWATNITKFKIDKL